MMNDNPSDGEDGDSDGGDAERLLIMMGGQW